MKKIPTRSVLVLFTFALSVLLYVDRVCISAANEPISQALSLSEKQMGWVFSAFALGYALFQIPGGYLSDRFGSRRVLTLVVCFWSLFTTLTGAARNLVFLITARFLFGIGEAGAFPGMARAFFSWIPVSERGIVQGINFSGSRLGAAFALPLVAWMISALGWRNAFYVLGGLGVVWAGIWYLWFRDSPENHPGISEKEKAFILKTRNPGVTLDETEERTPFSQWFFTKNMWLLMGQYFASNFTFFFCLAWLFPHLKEKYQLDMVETGWYSAAPFIFGALGSWISGYWVDRLYKKGMPGLSRKLPAIVGFALASAGILISVHMETPLGAVIFLSIAIFGADMTLSPSWTTCIDIGKKNSGALSGTMNMAGNVGSFLTALAFPYLKDWFQSVVPFFYICAFLNFLSMALWAMIQPDKKN